jgi:hypothetical protein
MDVPGRLPLQATTRVLRTSNVVLLSTASWTEGLGGLEHIKKPDEIARDLWETKVLPFEVPSSTRNPNLPLDGGSIYRRFRDFLSLAIHVVHYSKMQVRFGRAECIFRDHALLARDRDSYSECRRSPLRSFDDGRS